MLYTASGDLPSYAQYGQPRVLAVTPELTSQAVNFYIECEPNVEDILRSVVEQQKELLLRLLNRSVSLLDTGANAYAPLNFGKVALGGFAREVSGTVTQTSVRPSLQLHLWRPQDTGSAPSVLPSINGAPAVAMTPNRPGVHYNSWRADFRQLNPSDPYCVPCQLSVRSSLGAAGVSTGACSSGCVDLKDPNRLRHTTGWQLVSGPRPTTSTNPDDVDWWWKVTGSSQDEVLTIAPFTPPAQTTNCALSFTTEWQPPINGLTDPSILLLERYQGGTWQVVTSWKLDTPSVEGRTEQRLRSYLFEANSSLPTTTPEFRFRLPAGRTSSLKLFEPLLMCRFGSLP